MSRRRPMCAECGGSCAHGVRAWWPGLPGRPEVAWCWDHHTHAIQVVGESDREAVLGLTRLPKITELVWMLVSIGYRGPGRLVANRAWHELRVAQRPNRRARVWCWACGATRRRVPQGVRQSCMTRTLLVHYGTCGATLSSDSTDTCPDRMFVRQDKALVLDEAIRWDRSGAWRTSEYD